MTRDQAKSLGVETVPLVAEKRGEVQALPAQVVVPNHQQRVVSAPLGGLVEQVMVATQQSVKKGELLARMQSPGLADVQHTYLQAITQRELGRANLERDEKLYEADVIGLSRLQATRSRMNEVNADLAERTQALRLAGMSDASIAKLRAGRTVGTAIDLVAPIDGVVTEQLAVVGQRLDAAAPVFRIARLTPLWVEVQVPAARLSEITEGARVSVPAQSVSGKVIAIGRNVSPGNQTVTVRAEVVGGADRLRPGQLVEASIATAGSAAQWDVPNAALVRHDGRLLVFVEASEGFRARPVKLVSEGAERSLIAGDLAAEERIAVRGVSSLKAALAGIGVH